MKYKIEATRLNWASFEFAISNEDGRSFKMWYNDHHYESDTELDKGNDRYLRHLLLFELSDIIDFMIYNEEYKNKKTMVREFECDLDLFNKV